MVSIKQKYTPNGILYNSVNIQTNKKTKYHKLICNECNQLNYIPLNDLKEKIELTKKTRKASGEDIDRPVVTTFLCGNCQKVITTNIHDKDLEIYNNDEYNKEVLSITDSYTRILRSNGLII